MSDSNRQADKGRFAAGAVARLYSGNLSADQQRDLEAWLRKDDANRQEYEAVLALWDACGDLVKDVEIAESVMRPGTRPAPARRFAFHRLSWAALIVAGLVMAAIYASRLFPGPAGSMHETFATAVGGQLEVNLVDGSRLTLNTDTELRVDFDAQRRHIVMNRGEAFFDIRRDPERPLTVVAGQQAVTVLGTKFNLRWSGANVTVAVLDGSVAVRTGGDAAAGDRGESARAATTTRESAVLDGKEILLETGSIGVFSPASEPIVERTQAKVVDIPSWRYGLVRFENAPLYQVVAEINRYTETKIVIEDKSIMELKLTGAFRPTEVEAVLDGLQETLPVRVIAEFERYVIVGDQDPHRT